MLNKLRGHYAQITAIQMLPGTPLLLSADEIGFLKTWDIRTMECVQTLHFECKSSIHQFVIMNDLRFIGIEYRLHWFEFEDLPIVNANGIEINNMFPINIELNTLTSELCVATKSDIRIVDMKHGRTNRIMANIVEDQEGQQGSDITQFTLTHN